MSHLRSNRFRSLCLVLSTLVSLPSTADACCFLPLLDPFHWLHGCSRNYGPGNCGGYGGYGDPMAGQRFIDDWFGYGYLRNQQGTLGHYPGRPFGCYQPAYQGLMNPCAPCAPAMPMPGPMVAPMPAPMMPMQVPTMHEPCFDPCQSPCDNPCMPTPMVAPMPSYGQFPRARRARVPRRVQRRMQPQFAMPGPMYSAPMMPMQMGDMSGGCDGGCGGSMDGSMMMPTEGMVMDGGMMPDMNMTAPDSGCCGGDIGMDGSAMTMPQDYSSCMPDCGTMPYTGMSQWYGGAGISTMPSQTRRQTHLINQFERRFNRTLRTPRQRRMSPGMSWPGTMGWTPQMSPMTWQSGYNSMPGYDNMQAAMSYDDYGYDTAMYAPGYGQPMQYSTAMQPQMAVPMQA